MHFFRPFEQMAELQQLLMIQQNVFKEHLGRGDLNSSAALAASLAAAGVSHPTKQQKHGRAQQHQQLHHQQQQQAQSRGQHNDARDRDISLSTFDGEEDVHLTRFIATFCLLFFYHFFFWLLVYR